MCKLLNPKPKPKTFSFFCWEWYGEVALSIFFPATVVLPCTTRPFRVAICFTAMRKQKIFDIADLHSS